MAGICFVYNYIASAYFEKINLLNLISTNVKCFVHVSFKSSKNVYFLIELIRH